jgi:hypothetical protein
MKIARPLGVCALLLLGALVSPRSRGEEVAPELPVAGWQAGSVGLEDFKGQTTAIVFFNDSNG